MATEGGFDAAIIRSRLSNEVQPIGGGSGKGLNDLKYTV